MWKPRFSGKLHTKDLACESAGLCGFSPGVLWAWCGESAKLAPSSPPHCKVFQLLSQESRAEEPERKPCLGPVALGFYALVCLWVLRAEVAPE